MALQFTHPHRPSLFLRMWQLRWPPMAPRPLAITLPPRMLLRPLLLQELQQAKASSMPRAAPQRLHVAGLARTWAQCRLGLSWIDCMARRRAMGAQRQGVALYQVHPPQLLPPLLRRLRPRSRMGTRGHTPLEYNQELLGRRSTHRHQGRVPHPPLLGDQWPHKASLALAPSRRGRRTAARRGNQQRHGTLRSQPKALDGGRISHSVRSSPRLMIDWARR
mmetsp:Transcript_45379/g.107960  ORF Transcript_45379/g.107960 Transcript_45379/m.107960 type:complete len:220 (+) Transcript_45379:232-891(+)